MNDCVWVFAKRMESAVWLNVFCVVCVCVVLKAMDYRFNFECVLENKKTFSIVKRGHAQLNRIKCSLQQNKNIPFELPILLNGLLVEGQCWGSYARNGVVKRGADIMAISWLNNWGGFYLSDWSSQRLCLVSQKWMIWTWTAWYFSHFGGIMHNRYFTSSPVIGTYSPSILQRRIQCNAIN